MTKLLFLVVLLLNAPNYLAAQNLSWEEKVSPKHSYKLPQKEKSSSTSLTSVKRESSENPYDKLLAKREELKANIADFEQHQDSGKDKQWLDKYRVSLVLVEKQIQDYQASTKKKKK